MVLDTPAQYRTYLVGEIFCISMNNRLFKISRRADPPFYNAATQSEDLAQPVHSSLLNATICAWQPDSLALLNTSTPGGCTLGPFGT